MSSSGSPPVARLFDQFLDKGGELLLCPVCFKARALDEQSVVAGARVAGATPLWEWIGEAPATVFSY